jgi:hypothetical protein
VSQIQGLLKHFSEVTKRCLHRRGDVLRESKRERIALKRTTLHPRARLETPAIQWVRVVSIQRRVVPETRR